MYEDDYQLLWEENGIARNAGIVYETKDLYRNLTIQLKFFNKFWCVCVRADLRWKNRCQYTSAILFDQNCHQQIPGVDVHCFGVSNDICMRCTSMDMHQVFKGRPISGLPCYANTRAIIYSNSRLLQIYWCMHVIALTFHVLIIDEICFANYNW